MESELAEKVGLARNDLLKRRRGMVEGEDWKRGEKGKVFWTDVGVEKLGLGGVKVEPEVEPEGVIIRANFRNKRLVMARVGAEEKLVMVRDSGMYLPGQKFLLRRNGEGWTEARRPRKRGHF